VRRRAAQGGFTLLEMLIAIVLLAGLVAMMTSLTSSANRSQKFANDLMETLESNHDILNSISGALTSSVLVLTNSAAGNGYYDRLDLTGYPQPITSRLPTPRTDGTFNKEKAGETWSGNLLVFAELYRSDTFACSSTHRYRVPIIRIHAYYLSPIGDGPTAGKPDGLNLCHWVSEPLADAAGIDRIGDPDDRAEVLNHLLLGTEDVKGDTHRQVSVVWKVGSDPGVAGTLRAITSGGALDDNPPFSRGSTWKIVARTKPPARDLLAYRRLSVATNYAPRHVGVSSFSVLDNDGVGFPHGFEVQISGPVSARMILVRLVVVRATGGDQLGYSRYHIVAYTAQGQTT